tara:strand:+ start:213 stop:458 length:246 start_codon:yes stop_codon:yes gene_type:complete
MNTKSLNIFIYTFAIIGLVSILSSFNNQPEDQQSCSTVPESHAWEMYGSEGNTAFTLNKITGEVRRYYSSGKSGSVLELKD